MDVPWTPWQLCGRGHPLAVFGRLREHRSYRTYTCRECTRLYSHKQEPDPVVVERVVSGERPEYVHQAEMLAAVTILTRRGLSTSETARIAGVSTRTVCRMRLKIRKGVPYGQEAREKYEPSGREFRTPDHG